MIDCCMKIGDMKTRIVIVVIAILTASCAMAEKDIELQEKREMATMPVFASTTDSLKVFNAISSMQRSPEYIFSACTVFEDGVFKLVMSEEELRESGISVKDYKAYLQKLDKLNESFKIK